jgi:alpha-galactosidase
MNPAGNPEHDENLERMKDNLKTYQRKTVSISLIFCLTLTGIVWGQRSAKVYDARTDDLEILTPLASKAPRINGPRVYGTRPGKKFIYRIPCQGERPMIFEVKGLPEGLVLDSTKGILTGQVPEFVVDYEMTFNASNNHGSDSRRFTLVVGDKLALTPPTGWNHWGGHLSNVSAEIIMDAADLFNEKGLADVGFRYISIDDCWMRMSKEAYEEIMEPEKGQWYRSRHKEMDYEAVVGNTRDPDGNILSNSNFPDMKALADHIHKYGLKAGIYSGPGELTCQKMEASAGHELQDVEQYARWGYDLLKYDQCSAGAILKERRKDSPDYHQRELWKPMALFASVQDRNILFNLCQYGLQEPWTWAPDLGIQSWRIGGDLNHNVDSYFKQALWIATDLREYSKPGHWNDPDFIYIDQLGNHMDQFAPSKPSVLSSNQRYQYVTLWSIICAPFFFSCDIHKIDEFTLSLLTNADVLNINQDELGHVAEVILDKANETVLVKNMADGSKVLALFNRSDVEELVIRVNWLEIGEEGILEVSDVWRQQAVGNRKEGISVRLSPNGVAMLRVK